MLLNLIETSFDSTRRGKRRELTPQNCHFPLTCCVALTTV